MRVAQREGGDLALDVGAVADAHDVQLPREAGGDALHGVGRQRPRQPVQRGVLVGRALHFELAVGLLDVIPSGIGTVKLALRARHFQLLADL